MRNKIFQTAAMIGVAAILFSTGCGKKSEPEGEAKPAAPPFQRNESSLVGMVKQERSKIENDFKNLAIYYRLCANDNNGRGPAKWEHLKPYIGNDLPSLVQAIEEGRYVVIWKSGMSSNDVIAYEKQADTKGHHVAVFGDGHIVTISTDDLERAKKQK